LIESRGFRSESHTATTEDGYILTVFRIINPYIDQDQLKPNPLLLWHGVAVTSDSWLFSTAGEIDKRGIYTENNEIINDCHKIVTSNLAYTLSSCGYDVWLANSRGNHYSIKHTSLDANIGMKNEILKIFKYQIYDYFRYKVLGIHPNRDRSL